MATNGATNGAAAGPFSTRFSDIPSTIDIPVGDQLDEAVEVNLDDLIDDPTELCTLLENEGAARTYWMTVAMAYAKESKIDHAIEMLIRAGQGSTACAPEGVLVAEAKTKEYYLQLATSSLNDASRINPAFPPLFLARGVLQLLKASLQAPSASTGPKAVDPERTELLRQALKSFEDALRVSQGKNMLGLMGKARALYSMKKYPEALVAYQEVLRKMPNLVDPDPRIGIGCCLWQSGYKDDAKIAWGRSLELNPNNKFSNILLGLYYLDSSGQLPTNTGQKSAPHLRHFCGLLLVPQIFANVETLAHKAIQYTDVNAVASDGWYLLARKEHYEGSINQASDFYRRADDARGGTERGYLPAKFGAAQLSVLRNDLGEAKLQLEKMIQLSKNYEATILLGTLYAEEVFANQAAEVKDDKSAEITKAITLLETVRTAWKDPKKNLNPDASVLLNLARLYESDQPEKALQCLQQVEELEVAQLLNNIGCFYSQAEKHDPASEMFEAALGACVRIDAKDENADTDSLITTISYNLGRSYESRGMMDQAIEVYERLLARHDDYIDARTRLAYIKLRKNPHKEGPDAVAKLYQENNTDLEVRALYGWYLGKVTKKKAVNLNEDQEFRHYKHTLQHYDKHDRYALVGMGNLYLQQAREMRRETELEKQKRSATYSKAVEFFEKALSLDPKNAYAAMGIAIALAEDKKDLKSALSILVKVRETVKDAHVHVNLGHIYGELRQFSKAIEHYESALSKDGKENDPVILSCLGRTWLNKGRSDRDLDAYKSALACAKKALEAAPDQVHYKFNVAFVQIQLASTIYNLSEKQRALEQLEEAAEGLEAAIKALDEIATHPHTPYPKHDVEQRANMARNTQRKQLERAIANQKEYEEKNKEKLQAALEQRQTELKRREEERQKLLDVEREKQERIRKEREAISAKDAELAQARLEREKAIMDAEMTTDSETGDKIKRKRKPAPRPTSEGKPKRTPKKKKGRAEQGSGSEGEGERPAKRRRRLTKVENSKFKSAEIIVDSDESGDDDYGEDDALERAERNLERSSAPASDDEDDRDRNQSDDEDKMDVDNGNNRTRDDDEDDDAEEVTRRSRARRGRVVDSDEEDDENEGAGQSDDDAKPAAKDTSMVDADDDEDDE
ncbi:unnamed protein product [Parascedosporium putredinis]|uniref:Uncharacterized protein n=1 Tax=Parascedosporium putredinis TaxID=1442378 RepID=A0A9P1HB02_9PEZI|nr:unnamed protein product [Parascedosporium putredinis]CAI8003221.1 unnamed protein product [Parascedosporium putredinis]